MQVPSLSRSNLKRAKRLVAIFMLTVPGVLSAGNVTPVSLTDSFGNERVLSEITIDGLKISLETSRYATYSRNNYYFIFKDKEAGHRERIINTKVEAVRDNIIIPGEYFLTTTRLLNIDLQKNEELFYGPKSYPLPQKDVRVVLKEGQSYSSHQFLSAEAISYSIPDDVTEIDLPLCLKWDSSYLKNILPEPKQSEWNHPFRLCNPLTVRVVD